MNGHALGTTMLQTTYAVAPAAAPLEAAEANPGAEADRADGLALFQRALEAGDPSAWEAIVSRYRGLVLDWVRRSLRSQMPHEQADDWVTRTFERFWLAVGPEGCRFRDLPAALQYLKLCARSVVLDEARARRAAPHEALEDVDERRILGIAGSSRTAPDVESVVFGRLDAGDLWQTVLEALPDADERLVTYLSFVQGMKPGEIAAAHPARFAAADVYRIKRNALERLRRAPGLRDRFAPAAGAPRKPPAAPRGATASRRAAGTLQQSHVGTREITEAGPTRGSLLGVGIALAA